MRPYLWPLLFVALKLCAQDNVIKLETQEPMVPCSAAGETDSKTCAQPPHVTHSEGPVYPEQARTQRLEGTVVLKAVITADGKPTNLRVSQSPHPELNQAAIDAVNKWTFAPGTYDGKPVPVEMPIQINFRLSPTPSGASSANEEWRTLMVNATEAYGRRDYQTAANLARQVTAKYPAHTTAWNLLGISLLEMNELPAAEDALKRQIVVDRSSPSAYNNLGRVYWREFRYEEAEEQFRKQMVINPDDHYAHANLGMVLRQQKKCEAAMPELQKALSLTPNNAGVMLAQGECDLDLGNRAKGLSELEQATSIGPNAGTWNGAAYILAKHKTELDRAEKWALNALAMEARPLTDLAADHISVERFRSATTLASFWDTLGWIYSQKEEPDRAVPYLEAAWFLNPGMVNGDHLAQTYTRLGRNAEAGRYYAMALASAEMAEAGPPDPAIQAEVRERLTKAVGADTVSSSLDKARATLGEARTLSVANQGRASGSGDYVLVLAPPKKISGIHALIPVKTLQPAEGALAAAETPFAIPKEPDTRVPRRGTLICASDESTCRFVFLPAREAARLASREAAPDTSSALASAADPHIYNSPLLGMRLSLLDGWRLVTEERGSMNKPTNALFQKEGTLANLVLTHEHLEASAEVYNKSLETWLGRNNTFQKISSTPVVRNGLSGERWTVRMNAGGVSYSGIIEIFHLGDEHYRVSAMAPTDMYGRYQEAFEEMIRSLQFPMARLDPKVIDGVKP
jgi:TonB family protein